MGAACRPLHRPLLPSASSAAALQATRALMVVSLVLGFLAMFVATMGMKCTRCGGDDKVKKARIAMTGGIVFIVAGEPRSRAAPKAPSEFGPHPTIFPLF